MRSSSFIPRTARPPQPQHIDSTSTVPISASPRSPLSPYSPSSTMSDQNTTSYFADAVPISRVQSADGSPHTGFPSPPNSSSPGSPTAHGRHHSSSYASDGRYSTAESTYAPAGASRPKSYTASSEPTMASSSRYTTATPSKQGIAPSPQPLSRKQKRTSGTHTDCGRHGDEWLFGNFSIRDSFERMIRS